MPFDTVAATRAIEFFERYLVHIDGEWAGQPFVPFEWQTDVLRTVFGTKREDNGLRQYRKVFVEIPRKNGKSELAAGLALKLLVADAEPGSQVYIAAQNRQQAGIIFRVAAEMVMRNDELRESCDVLQSVKRILFPRTGSFLQVLPGDALTAHGINAHAVIFDELHTQKNRALYEVLSTSMGARRQPLMVMLTTAGFETESLWGQERDYALKVRSNVIDDPTYLPVLYGADPKDDFKLETTWRKANPSYDALGPTFQSFIATQAKKAADSPVDLNSFLRLHLNIPTRQDIRWMPIDDWDASGSIVVPEELKGRRCYAGLDLSSTEDLTAFAMVFPPKGGDAADDGVYDVLVRFWLPEATMRRRVRTARVPYDAWAAEGFLKLTEGEQLSYAAVHKDIQELGQQYEIAQINYDPWNAAQIVQDLTEDGFTCVLFQQAGRLFNAPLKELMRLVKTKRLHHGGHRVLRWNVDNVTVHVDSNGLVRPDKQRSREKIDGLVALVMAVDGAMRNRGESVYEERGILSL